MIQLTIYRYRHRILRILLNIIFFIIALDIVFDYSSVFHDYKIYRTEIILCWTFIAVVNEFRLVLFTWLNEPKWLNRICLYSILFIIAHLSLDIFFSYSSYIPDYNNAVMYLLSAQVQSEATIMAIVVTLSLVAIQLASASYSPQVIDAFKKTPDFWIVLIIYMSAILYSLWILSLVKASDIPVSLNHVLFSYKMMAFCLIALIPYLGMTFDLMSPAMIIKLLAQKITLSNIYSSEFKRLDSKHKKKVQNFRDPISPLSNIINESIYENDIETASLGIRAIEYRIIHIFNKESIEYEEMSEYIMKIFDDLGMYCLKNNNFKSSMVLIESLGNIGRTVAKNKNYSATFFAETSLQDFSFAAEKKGIDFKNVSLFATESLGSIAGLVIDYSDKTKLHKWYRTRRSLSSGPTIIDKLSIDGPNLLQEIGINSIESNFTENAVEASKWLRIIGEKAVAKDIDFLKHFPLTQFNNILKSAIYNKEITKNVTDEIISNFKSFGIEVAKEGKKHKNSSKNVVKYEKNVLTIIEYLADIGVKAANEKKLSTTSVIVKSMEEITIWSSYRKKTVEIFIETMPKIAVATIAQIEQLDFRSDFSPITKSLSEIAISKFNEGDIVCTNKAISSLSLIGKETVRVGSEQKYAAANSEYTTQEVLFALEKIGMTVVRGHNNKEAINVLNYVIDETFKIGKNALNREIKIVGDEASEEDANLLITCKWETFWTVETFMSFCEEVNELDDEFTDLINAIFTIVSHVEYLGVHAAEKELIFRDYNIYLARFKDITDLSIKCLEYLKNSSIGKTNESTMVKIQSSLSKIQKSRDDLN